MLNFCRKNSRVLYSIFRIGWMDAAILQEFVRLKFRVDNGIDDLPDEVKKLPAAMAEIAQVFRFNRQLSNTILFDRWGDRDPSMMYALSFGNYDNMIQDPKIVKGDWYVFSVNQHYSSFLIKVDDDFPVNPTVYYLDHDFREEGIQTFNMSVLSFLRRCST